ncbi:hypothetical protein [Methylobacter tundripaludum]|uniref:hypothetical protein n=1 Tax=Methylobacter tundripaludum TaxID=173365 RepID=UPI0004DF341F|nr:hypothetical protein [Methylobacter tundripaludum]
MTEENTNSIGRLPKWQQYTIFFILFFSGMALVDTGKKYLAQHKTPTSIESAKSQMIGTWTYAEPLDFNNDPFPYEWVKWEIREDGTMTAWHASPSDANWPEGETKKYEVITDKFSNNGERWYGIEDTNGYMVGVYENGHIVLHPRPAVTQKTVTMQRGNKNPFSK